MFNRRTSRNSIRIQPLIDPVVKNIEREIHELLDINFVGHPQLTRLLFPEEWPEGVYPLRKDYQGWDPNAVRDRGA